MTRVSTQAQHIERRTVLATGLAGGAGIGATALGATRADAGTAKTPPPARSFFRHGVASGDPLPDRVVLWTRVTPTADATPGSGVGPDAKVTKEVATDPASRRSWPRACGSPPRPPTTP